MSGRAENRSDVVESSSAQPHAGDGKSHLDQARQRRKARQGREAGVDEAELAKVDKVRLDDAINGALAPLVVQRKTLDLRRRPEGAKG